MPGPFYSRYVPPAAPTTSAPETTSVAEVPAQDTSPRTKLRSEVKQKKKAKPEKPKKRKREEKQDEGLSEDVSIPKKQQAILEKFRKSAVIADVAAGQSEDTTRGRTPSPEPVLHDLVPLPQPEPIPETKYEPAFASLPSWLAKPITAPADARTPFKDLNIDPKLTKHLSSKGYHEAFAVQSAILPLLLPGSPHTTADICVSAATGSGKTLAYILPLVESLRHRAVIKLRGIVVVPTRELVTQVREAAELCSVGSGLKIGTAVGSQSFAAEQESLVRNGRRYDPKEAAILHEKANARILHGWAEKDQTLERALEMLPGHIPSYESKIDILICTPGRLVEHIQSTTGFSMDDVQWLIIDEADRLLDQSFQGWSEVVIKALEREKSAERLSAREKALSKLWHPQPKQSVRKVILSATMTRDLNKLSALKLRRPLLVVNEGAEGFERKSDGEVFNLPPTLWEAAIPVGDGSKKPLYLLHLLQQNILYDLSGSDSDSDSDSDSSDDESASTDPTEQPRQNQITSQDPSQNVLIFTHNNENANRLSRLLQLLHPPYKNIIGTLTKSSTTTESRKILRAFRAGKLRILIASDRASRGLDLPNLAHIVNYDLPASVTSYVHRVGRTARAGMEGTAWTFFTKTEAAWFWHAIAKGNQVRRGENKVERTKLEDAVSEDQSKKYVEALNRLRDEVRGDER
ncbi:P-loop containing nucleoside triphosphate hydrolase protein [Saccharata proteae CBS 121410]|uniref:ATP-dependent RNA helicase n=1 Tax=Saccharata proteae CBS 121410 TaxID=1314787 RepID=A0A9P4HS09_9PEZI|nr:P-loop containing nucleoside triphosphate hydrolase protein [Saccharata proteae CBS 121410]